MSSSMVGSCGEAARLGSFLKSETPHLKQESKDIGQGGASVGHVYSAWEAENGGETRTGRIGRSN